MRRCAMLLHATLTSFLSLAALAGAAFAQGNLPPLVPFKQLFPGLDTADPPPSVTQGGTAIVPKPGVPKDATRFPFSPLAPIGADENAPTPPSVTQGSLQHNVLVAPPIVPKTVKTVPVTPGNDIVLPPTASGQTTTVPETTVVPWTISPPVNRPNDPAGPVVKETALGVMPAHAEKRVALLIGNSGYQHADKLANPRYGCSPSARRARKARLRDRLRRKPGQATA